MQLFQIIALQDQGCAGRTVGVLRRHSGMVCACHGCCGMELRWDTQDGHAEKRGARLGAWGAWGRARSKFKVDIELHMGVLLFLCSMLTTYSAHYRTEMVTHVLNVQLIL